MAAGSGENPIAQFLRLESASGILLLVAAVLALIADNSPLAGLYETLFATRVEIRVGAFQLAKPLQLWVNDGLMAVFFLLVGLEIKRELLEGELTSMRRAILPASAALGGMALPSLIYVAFNRGDPAALRGFAIPAATDIAFALGALSLLGSRVPASLKVFLAALAILDDLGAIVIIALFYSGDLAVGSLAGAAVCLAGLLSLNLSGVRRFAPYVLLGIALWICVLKSGVHATLAGALLAFAIPLRSPAGEPSPLREMEHGLHPWVAYGIMPLFAFANAGVSMAGIGAEQLLHPIALGVAAGLLLGKTLGVFLCTWLPVRLGLAVLPDGASWRHVLGISLLAGIGFTMSLFIGGLAFEDPASAVTVRIGVIGGSLASGILGILVLRSAGTEKGAPPIA